MAAEKYLNSEETRQYLADRHNLHRSPVTLGKMANDGRLPADKFDGRRRLHAVSSIDAYAARQMRPNVSETEGIPMGRDLRSKKFAGSGAGAEATERRRNVEHARGGRNRDVDVQKADTQRGGRTGHDTGRSGAGRIAASGGWGSPGNKSRIGISADAEPGITGGSTRASRPRPSRSDYSKEGPKRFR
jgi:hypothetical protein